MFEVRELDELTEEWMRAKFTNWKFDLWRNDCIKKSDYPSMQNWAKKPRTNAVTIGKGIILHVFEVRELDELTEEWMRAKFTNWKTTCDVTKSDYPSMQNWAKKPSDRWKRDHITDRFVHTVVLWSWAVLLLAVSITGVSHWRGNYRSEKQQNEQHEQSHDDGPGKYS